MSWLMSIASYIHVTFDGNGVMRTVDVLGAVMALGVVNVGMGDLVAMVIGIENVGINDLVVTKCRVLANNADQENAGVVVEHVGVIIVVEGDSNNFDGSVVTIDDGGVVDVIGVIVVLLAVVVNAGETVVIRRFTGV